MADRIQLQSGVTAGERGSCIIIDCGQPTEVFVRVDREEIGMCRGHAITGRDQRKPTGWGEAGDDNEASELEAWQSLAKYTGDRIDQMRKIVDRKQAASVEGHMVDLVSASVVVQVWDRMEQEAAGGSSKRRGQLEKLAAVPLLRLVEFAFKVAK